jgi:large subunit ribosomal protein L30
VVLKCQKYLTANQPSTINKAMAKVKIKLVKSGIDRPERQKRTLAALGLNKMQRTVEKENTPQIQGMIQKVKHLIEVKES